MQRKNFGILVAGIFFAGTVLAETYDYEVDLSYSSFDSDSVSFPFNGGVPDPTQGSSTTSSSDDDLSISGSWYYTGLVDDNGPRSRAEFVSRASSVSFAYSRLDGDSSFASNFFGFSISGSSEQTANSFGVDLRHVWKESGWYVLAGLASLDADLSFTDSQGNTFEDSADGNLYLLGFGKYLASTTALDIVIADADVNGSNGVNIVAELSHIGDLGENWQFGADLGVGFADNDNRAYNAQLSLYPNRDVAFGVSYNRQEDDEGFSPESSSVSGFASWFLNETTVVRASVSSGDSEGLGIDGDSDGFTIGVTMRF